jgi:hypothetical protein
VGYTLFDAAGTVIVPRTIAGVTETVPNAGLYAADVTFPDAFRGVIVWDTGTFFSKTYHATEDYNPLTVSLDSGSIAFPTDKIDEILGTVQAMTGTLDFIRDMTSGRWIIEDNMMKFYAEDNVTLVAQFELFDENGVPSMGSVFERVKVP